MNYEQEFHNINSRLDKIIANMVVKEEIQDLEAGLPTKEDYHLLQTAVDGIAKSIALDDTERKVQGAQIKRLEEWVTEAAPIVGVDYNP